MLKRIITLLLVMILVSGCSKKEVFKEISFSSWGSITEVGILKKIISEYESENPDVKINFIHIPQNYFPKIHLLFASNTAPDVLFINNLNLPIYADYLEDLSKVIDTEDYYIQSIEGLTYQDKLLAIPRDVSNLLLYVNLDLVDISKEKFSIDDMLNIAQKTTKDGVWGIGYEADVYWALPYLAYYGGGILDENFENIFQSAKSQEGLAFYKNLVQKYRVAPSKSQVGSSTLAQMFIDGKIAMYLSGRWMYPKITEKAKFNWAVVTFPVGVAPQPCDTSGWAISKKSKNKEIAMDFVKYISSAKSSEYFARSGLVVPARISVSKILDNEQHNEKAFLEAVKISRKTFVDKNYKKLVDKINKDLEI